MPPSRAIARGAAVFLGLLLPLAGCAAPKRAEVRDVGLNRESPRAAYEYLRAMVRAEQPEAEWKTFSPGFRRRLSEQVGRTIDVGDYVQARSTVATNRRKEIQLLLDSEFVAEKAASDKVSVVTIRAGGQQARPRFIKLTTWELYLKGEGEPVAEFVPATADVITISPTGQVEMRISPSDSTASFLRDTPQDRIQGFTIREYWYLDDFGGVEAAVIGGLRGEAGPDAGAQTPRGAAPGGRPPPPLPAPGGDPNAPAAPGSPEGPAPGGGFGSPDGSPPPTGSGIGSPGALVD